MIDLATLTIQKAHDAMKKGVFSAVDLAQAYLDAIKENDGDIHAYLEVYGDVLEQAKYADKKFKDGSATVLTGIPIAVKDNILIKGRIVSAASRMLENYKASYDAHVIGKLKAAGAVFVGRTNMDEFAMGGSTENSAFGPTKIHTTQRACRAARLAALRRRWLWAARLWHSAPILEAPFASRRRSAVL